MKKTVTQKLNEALGLAQEQTKDGTKEIITSEVLPPMAKQGPTQMQQDARQDYQYTRGVYYDLIGKGQDAVKEVIKVAGASEEPRAYEVTAILIKAVAEVARELTELQRTMQFLDEPVEEPKNVTNVNNNTLILNGTTNEILRALKEAKKKKASQEYPGDVS